MASTATPAATGASQTLNVTLVQSGGANWTSGTTFALSNLSGATLNSKTFVSATQYTLNITLTNSIGILDITDSVNSFVATLQVYNWSLILDDSFQRGNTSVGTAGNITSVGGNWDDVTGGKWNINSLALIANYVAGSAYNNSQLLRPTTDNLGDTQYTVDLGAPQNSSGSSNYPAVVVHRQDSTDYYLFELSSFYQGSVACAINLYSVVGGAATFVNSSSNVSPTSGHTFELTVSVRTVGASSYLTGTITDTTTSTLLGTLALTTNTAAGLQVSGQHGLSFGLTANTQTFSRVRIYQNAPTSMSPSAASISLATNTAITFTGVNVSWNGSTAFTIVNAGANASIQSQTNNSATSQTVTFAGGSKSGSFLVSDGAGTLFVIYTANIAMVASPQFLLAGGGNQTVTMTGIGTSWTSGTTFTVSGSFGASPTLISSTNVNGTTQTLVINPGATGGIITVTEATDGITCALNSFYTMLPTDSNLSCSANWGSNGTGAPSSATGIQAGATTLETIWPGAWLAFDFSGTALMVTFNVASADYVHLHYSVNDGPAVELTLSASQPAININNLVQGTQTFWMAYTLPETGERWTTQAGSVIISSIQFNGASAAATTGMLWTHSAIVYGDSYQEGVGTSSLETQAVTYDDTGLTIAYTLCHGLQCNPTVFCAFGQGYLVASSTGVPALFTGTDGASSWNKLWSGNYFTYTSGTQSATGQAAVQPKYVICIMGTNDRPDNQTFLATSVQDFLAAARVAYPAATIIILLPPCGNVGGDLVGIPNGYTAYQAATPDSEALYISIPVQPGLTATAEQSTGNLYSPDQLHPRVPTSARCAGRYLFAIGQATATGGGGGSGSNAILGGAIQASFGVVG